MILSCFLEDVFDIIRQFVWCLRFGYFIQGSEPALIPNLYSAGMDVTSSRIIGRSRLTFFNLMVIFALSSPRSVPQSAPGRVYTLVIDDYDRLGTRIKSI